MLWRKLNRYKPKPNIENRSRLILGVLKAGGFFVRILS